MSDLKFRASADLRQIKTDLQQFKTLLQSLAQEAKIEVKVNIANARNDIQQIRTLIHSQLGSANQSVNIRVSVDQNQLRADIATIKPTINAAMTGISGANYHLRLGVDIQHLMASLAAAKSMINAWISNIRSLPSASININTGTFEQTMRRAALVISKAMRDLRAEIALLRGSLSGLGSGSTVTAAQMATLQQQVQQLRAQLDQMRSQTHSGSAAFAGMRGQVTQLISTFAGLYGVHLFLGVTDEAKRFEGQLRLVTKSQEELINVQRMLTASANATGTELAGSISMYSKLKLATGELNGTSNEMLVRLTDITNKFVALGGAPIETANAALFQFSQALGKGKLNGDEFVSIMEGALPLANAMAQGMGMTIGQFTQAAHDQQVTTESMINALLKMGKVADEQFGKMPRTSAQAMTELRRNFKDFVAQLDKDLGFSEGVINSIKLINDNLKTVVYWIGVIGAATGIKLLISGIVAARVAIVKKIVDMQAHRAATIAQTQADLSAARMAAALATQEIRLAQAEVQATIGTNNHSAALSRLTAARIADTVATRNLTAAQGAATAAQTASLGVGRSLLALLGGVGGLLTIIGSVAAAFLLMRDNTNEAKTALDRLGASAADAKEKLSELGYAQKQKLFADSTQQIKDTQSDMQRSIENFTEQLVNAGADQTDAIGQQLWNLAQEVTSGKKTVSTAMAEAINSGLLKGLDAERISKIRTAASETEKYASSIHKQAKEIDLLTQAEGKNKEKSFGAVTEKTVAPKLDRLAIEMDVLEARIAADKQYTDESRKNIQRLGVLKLAELEKERQTTLGNAAKQGEVIRKILAQQMENSQALSDFDSERTQRSNDQAAAMSDARTSLLKEQINREMAALDAQHSAEKISTVELYHQKSVLLERLQRIELANLDFRLSKAKSNEREKLLIQRQTMIEAQKAAGEALNSQSDQALKKLAEDIQKAHGDVIDGLSKNTDALAAEGMSELDRQLHAVEQQFDEAKKKIDALKDVLNKQGITEINIEADDGTAFTLTKDFIVSREEELQRQVEEAKKLVREEYANKRAAEEAKLMSQLTRQQGYALSAEMQDINSKWRETLEKMKKAGDTAGIQVVIEIIRREKLQAQADDVQQRIQKEMNRQTSREGALDQAASTDWRQQLVLDQSKNQVRAETQANLAPMLDELKQLQGEGAQGLDQQIADLTAKLKDLEQQVPTTGTQMKLFFADIAKQGKESVIDGLTDSFMSMVDGSKSAKEAFKDMAKSFALSMAQIAARALATYLVLQTLDAIFPGLGKATAATMSVGQNHTGGLAGSPSPRRSVDPAIFGAAPRYHIGGIAGLRPGEIPAILERGEEVLTRNDPRHVANGGAGGGNWVRVVNVIDPSLVQDYMSSSSGEQTILNVMQRNAGTIKQILG